MCELKRLYEIKGFNKNRFVLLTFNNDSEVTAFVEIFEDKSSTIFRIMLGKEKEKKAILWRFKKSLKSLEDNSTRYTELWEKDWSQADLAEA